MTSNVDRTKTNVYIASALHYVEIKE